MPLIGRLSRLNPHDAAAHSSLLYALHLHPGYDAQALYQEHVLWQQRHAQPLRKFIQPHLNDRSPDRRLRIGYVSPDLRRHPVGLFLWPLLAAHDKVDFEIFCYADVRVPDEMTERLRAQADQWRSIVGRTDEQVAARIREDHIDILVDLTMHTAGHRLLVFARKPAPVQVTYLAYCSTTGLDTIDYGSRIPPWTLREVTPCATAGIRAPAGNLLVLHTQWRNPRQCLARVAARLCHLRLPEQLLQNHPADPGDLGPAAAQRSGFRVSFCMPILAVIAKGCWIFWEN